MPAYKPPRVKPGITGKPSVSSTDASAPRSAPVVPAQPDQAATGNQLLTDLFSSLSDSSPVAAPLPGMGGGTGNPMDGLSQALGTPVADPAAAAAAAAQPQPASTMMPNAGGGIWGLSQLAPGAAPMTGPVAQPPDVFPGAAKPSVIDLEAASRPALPSMPPPAPDAPQVDRADLAKSREGAFDLSSLIPAIAALSGHNAGDVGMYTPEIMAQGLKGADEGALQRYGFNMEDWGNQLKTRDLNIQNVDKDYGLRNERYEFDVNKRLAEQNAQAMAAWRMGGLGVNEEKALTQGQRMFDALDPQSQVNLQTQYPDYAEHIQRPLVRDPVSGQVIPYGTVKDQNGTVAAAARAAAAAAAKQRADAYSKAVDDLVQTHGWSHDIADQKLKMQAIKDGNNFEIAKKHLEQGQARIDIARQHLSLAKDTHNRVMKIPDLDARMLALDRVRANALKSKAAIKADLPYAVTQDEADAKTDAMTAYDTVAIQADDNIQRAKLEKLARANAAAAKHPATGGSGNGNSGGGGGGGGGGYVTPSGLHVKKISG